MSATVGADPADITYLYESPPGFVLMCMRLYALIWFLRAILITRLKYTRKRGFYWKFAVLGGLWMIALPFQVGLANLVIAVHIRPKFVFAFTVVLNVIFFLVMFFLFSPSRFNRAFPFHAKTSDMEARAPASTSWSSGGRGGAAQHNGVARTSASGGTSQSGGVEMTPNGPIFRSRPNAASGGTGRTDLSSRGSATMSGGLAMGTPEERVRFSIQKIRTKITQLADHSDDLEYALDEMDLHEWDSPNVRMPIMICPVHEVVVVVVVVAAVVVEDEWTVARPVLLAPHQVIIKNQNHLEPQAKANDPVLLLLRWTIEKIEYSYAYIGWFDGRFNYA